MAAEVRRAIVEAERPQAPKPPRAPAASNLRQVAPGFADLGTSLWRNRDLIRQLTSREVIGRYKGSILGLLWSFVHPLLMLAVYTLVFGVVFKARWSGADESKIEFALVLFSGMIVFGIFSECVGRAPGLILANANFVKKVVFPLEILAWVAIGSALFHAAVSFAVWLTFYVFVFGPPPATIVLFPLVVVDVVLLTVGLTWFLASLGVYVRDMAPLIGIVVSTLMFLSPIFYPLTAIPEAYRDLFYLNPLTYPIELTRDTLFWGKAPAALPFTLYTLVCGGIAWLGFVWFQKTRRGFADVL